MNSMLKELVHLTKVRRVEDILKEQLGVGNVLIDFLDNGECILLVRNNFSPNNRNFTMVENFIKDKLGINCLAYRGIKGLGNSTIIRITN